MQKMEGKAREPLGVNTMTVESSETGIYMIMKLCQRVLDGGGMPDEWRISVIVPVFYRKK